MDAIIEQLPGFLAGYATKDGGIRDAVRASVASIRAPREEWAELRRHMRTIGSDFGQWPRNELATRLTGAYMRPLLSEGCTLEGLDQLDLAVEQTDGRRLMIVGNHLSYADISSFTSLLEAHDRGTFRRRIAAVAGPKVYADPMRRLAASGIGTIKVAQSASVASAGAEMSPRDVVRIAKRCLGEASELMDAGRVVLIYPEGTRSRSGRLGPFLRATNRWLTLPGVVVLPVAVWGSEQLYRIDEGLMHPADCHVRFGPAIDIDALRAGGTDRDGVLRTARDAIATLLPEAYRPEPGAPAIA